LGATPEISHKILDAWRAGIITGFSIIANGTGLESIPGKLNEHPDLEARISVHLNISDGRSLLPSEEVSGLVDRNGYFRYGFLGLLLKLFVSTHSTRRRLIGEIESEWREQIHRTKEICSGRKIQAIDGHIHVHMIPYLFPVAAKLAVEEDIPDIRIPRELWSFPDRIRQIFSLQFFVNGMKWILLRILACSALKLKTQLNLGGPSAFIGVINTGKNTKSAVLASLKRLRKIGIDSCEILFHIGGAPEEEVSEWNPLNPTYKFLISDGRQREYEELVELRSYIHESNLGSEPTT
jgi:predicted glycoside hydrolase/deacetylase ChbG (UPF0249 family)